MGDRITPTLVLQCKHCGHRPPADSVMEAFVLHCEVEHDIDTVAMDLVAVCTCGTTMTLTGVAPTGGGFRDWYECPACGNTGSIKRGDAG